MPIITFNLTNDYTINIDENRTFTVITNGNAAELRKPEHRHDDVDGVDNGDVWEFLHDDEAVLTIWTDDGRVMFNYGYDVYEDTCSADNYSDENRAHVAAIIARLTA